VRAFGGGDLIAVTTLQPGLRWFETSFGAWAYQHVAGVDITLGGPLCAPGDRREMLRRFLARSRRPILFYLRRDMLEELDDAELYGAGIGVDRHVDIPALRGAPSKPVRGAIKRARKAKLELRELELETLDRGTRARIDQITARYLAHAEVNTQMTFLNRPMSCAPDRLRRVFALDKYDREHQGMFGYVVLNPIFDAGQRSGWLLDILRFEPTRLWGVWLSTVDALARLLEHERQGEALSLGYAPLHRIQPAPHSASRVLQAQLDWMVRYLSTTPYLTRLRQLKDAIPGTEEQRYVASYTRAAPKLLYTFVEAMGVEFRNLLGPGLIPILREGIQQQYARQLETLAWQRRRTSKLG
jgi:lysylphosphatidylglycerol synthetase-like protein (DUF2156 family)